jgi:hypothetical protein
MSSIYNASLESSPEKQETAQALKLTPEDASLIARAVCKGIWFYTLTSLPVVLVLSFLIYAINHS